jgi:hypothetical protein
LKKCRKRGAQSRKERTRNTIEVQEPKSTNEETAICMQSGKEVDALRGDCSKAQKTRQKNPEEAHNISKKATLKGKEKQKPMSRKQGTPESRSREPHYSRRNINRVATWDVKNSAGCRASCAGL